MKKVYQVFRVFLMFLMFMTVTLPNFCVLKSAFGKISPSLDPKNPSVDYVVAVKRSTYNDAGWKKVAQKLEAKHHGKVVVYQSRPEEILPALKAMRPQYLCVVMKPGDATKQAIMAINQLTRRLDKDPYGDVIWGLVTGYTAADALRMAAVPQLPIKRGLGKTKVAWLRYLESGAYYSEAVKNHKYIKHKGGKMVNVPGPGDTTAEIVRALNAGKVDIMWTSGHASESDWELGWAFPDGVFFTDAGQLKARDTSGREYRIRSPRPLVYYGPGNCLIGHINNPRNCMALSWIRAGAGQFAGYVKPSGYGYMGWGIGEYFFPLKDRFTFAESVFLNNQALIFDLKNNIPGTNKGAHQGDRDQFAFYGDPALEARIVSTPEPPLYSQNLTFENIGKNQYRVKLSVTMAKKGKVVRPAAAFLPQKVVSIKDLKTNSYKVDVSDNFILMMLNDPSKQELSRGETRYATFIANCAEEKVAEEKVSKEKPLPLHINLKAFDIAAKVQRQIQAESYEALVKKDLSMIITLKVDGQIQKTDPWTDPKSDPHNWHKPMYYIALDANGDPRDGYYDNGKGPYSALIQYDSGRYRLIWGGPDQNIRTKADNVVCPPTGWLREGMSLEGIECAEDFAVSISEDGTSLIVYLRQHLIGNPASLEVSFMASPYTSSHFDILGNKPGDDGQKGWMAIPDATLQRTYSKKDAPEKLAWPLKAPDLKANFDIIEGEVQILHVQ